MNCDCCGKRKRLTESFEEIKSENGIIHLCVDCSNDLYNMRDLLKEKSTEEYESRKAKIEKKSQKATTQFIDWYKQFLKKISN